MTGTRAPAAPARFGLSGYRTLPSMLGGASPRSGRSSPRWPRQSAPAALWLALVLVAAAGCRKVPDFSAYRDQASALVSEHSAELIQLGKRLDGLRRRAAALAEGAPGVAEARERVARCELTANDLRDAVSGLVGKVGSAIKTAEAGRVERTLSVAAAQIERGVTALRTELDAAASELARAEEAAPPAKAPPAR